MQFLEALMLLKTLAKLQETMTSEQETYAARLKQTLTLLALLMQPDWMTEFV